MNLNHPFAPVGNVNLDQIVEKYGLPLYVYDASIIERQYKRLVDAFDYPKLKIHYACKALSNLNILRLVKSFGGGLDAVSIQEVMLGLKAGFDPKEILYTPNGVSLDELHEAVKLGVKINIDNLSTLEHFGHEFPDYHICIRLNPHVMAGGNSKISTGHIDSKFGISIHQLPHILRIVQNTGLIIEGLHMHTGSEILDANVFLQVAEIMFNATSHFHHLDYIDFGSGFTVSYTADGNETNVEELGKAISSRFAQFCDNYGKDLELIFEPGKYLVSEAGYFLTRVNTVKQTTSTVFAGVDSGFNHLIRPMFYNSYHEISNLSKPQARKRIYTVVGYVCETDTFAVNRKIEEINEGDVLCFHNAGAYCYTMSSNYNSRLRPAEILLLNGKDHLISKRETFEDIVKNQVILPELKEESEKELVEGKN